MIDDLVKEEFVDVFRRLHAVAILVFRLRDVEADERFWIRFGGGHQDVGLSIHSDAMRDAIEQSLNSLVEKLADRWRVDIGKVRLERKRGLDKIAEHSTLGDLRMLAHGAESLKDPSIHLARKTPRKVHVWTDEREDPIVFASIEIKRDEISLLRHELVLSMAHDVDQPVEGVKL